jgi:DNA-binding response OmpR family regulator
LGRSGEAVAVEPQVFDLLVYLVGNRDRVVSKDDLIGAVWGGRAVSDSTLTSRTAKRFRTEMTIARRYAQRSPCQTARPSQYCRSPT